MGATVIAGLLIALISSAILGAIRSRWLYVIAPKLYFNTTSANGHIVTLTIYNAGLVSEEDVALCLRPACQFSLIGTTKSSLTVNGNILLIPKLARMETITVLLLITGRTFDQSDIESIESKSVKGKVIERKEQAAPAWQGIIGIPILVLIFLLPFLFGTVVGAEMQVSMFRYLNNQYELLGPSKQLAGFKNSVREFYSDGTLKGIIKKSLLDIKVEEVIRRDDILTITIKFKNGTKHPLLAEGWYDGSAGDGPLSFSDSRIDDFALAPDQESISKIKIFMPETTLVKMTKGTLLFKTVNGDEVRASQIIEFK